MGEWLPLSTDETTANSMGFAVHAYRASRRCWRTLLFEPASSQQPSDEMGQFATSLSDIALGFAQLYRAPRFLFTLLKFLAHNNASAKKRAKLMEVAAEPRAH